MVRHALAVVLAFVAVSAHAADKVKPDDLVAKHLDSIGPAEARITPHARELEGIASSQVLVGGSGQVQGSGRFMSRGEYLHVIMRFNRSDYPGEDFLYNGQRPIIGQTTPGKRSPLGTFLDQHTDILREGLLGGVLSTAWPLQDLKRRNAKLSYDGLKNVDGQKLHQATYSPHKGVGEMKIYLFFEPTASAMS